MRSRAPWGIVPAVLALGWAVACAQQQGPGRRPGGGHGGQDVFRLDVPAHDYDVILARPERSRVTLSLLAYRDLDCRISYGTAPNGVESTTSWQPLKSGVPAQVVLQSLQPNARYRYRVSTRISGSTSPTESPEYEFHTARLPGETFTFTMTADAHLDEHTSPEVYDRTLRAIRAERPDFHLDLGNLFMTDKHATRDEAARQYLAQRYHLGLVGCGTPILLALGTHEGEAARYDDGTDDCLAAWASRTRKKLFPNPEPDDFYTGDTRSDSRYGAPADYYAWEWGQALFVVLDPFRYSSARGAGRDGWGWSLGEVQYRWLAKTLSQSRAPFKFVFIHNLLTGDQASRGGVEVAGFNEWGGNNLDGTDGFSTHRPGWEMPIHRLLVKYRVAAVFKAHDNFFAHQELDGIAYQMIPQPSFAGDDRIRDLENYGYKKGTFLGNSGYVRVTVGARKSVVEYVRTPQTADRPGEVACRYEIPAR